MITWIEVGNGVAIVLIAGGVYWLWNWAAAIHDRFVAGNRQRHAIADAEATRAVQVRSIPGVTHQAIIVSAGEWELIDIKPPPEKPIEISFDERLIRDHLLALIEASIEAQNGNGDAQKILPEAETSGSMNYFWKESTDYAVGKGWIVKHEKQPTVCRGDITLAVIRRALKT
jgi:hypothetical protein